MFMPKDGVNSKMALVFDEILWIVCHSKAGIIRDAGIWDVSWALNQMGAIRLGMPASRIIRSGMLASRMLAS
jgi:hypothetical protein